MFSTPEQMLDAGKAQFETAVAFGAKALEGYEKLLNLNIAAAKASYEESAETMKSMLSVKDVQELFSFTSGLAQPTAEKAMSYSKQVYEIASATSGELSKLVEAQVAESNKALVSAIDGLSKNAPAGTESTVALVKSALSAVNNAYDSVTKAAKQAVELTEQNIAAATNATVKAATVKPVRKAA